MDEPVEQERNALRPFVELMSGLVDRSMSADEVERRYIDLWGNDTVNWSEPVFRAIEDFFFAIDDYVADDELRREVNGIDADQLRAKAAETLHRLDELCGPAT